MEVDWLKKEIAHTRKTEAHFRFEFYFQMYTRVRCISMWCYHGILPLFDMW